MSTDFSLPSATSRLTPASAPPTPTAIALRTKSSSPTYTRMVLASTRCAPELTRRPCS